jgi:hypothetical protein
MSIFDSPGLTNTPSGQQNQSVSGYAAPYVQNMLNQTQALASTPMPQYTGQLTAGPSDLQNQAFQGLSNLTIPGGFGTAQTGLTNVADRAMNIRYDPYQLSTQDFNNQAAQKYMNPYIQSALQPAQQLLNQQYGMQSAAEQGAATSKGAFGGSRQALMSGLNEQNRNLASNQLVSNAYNTAFQQAQAQFNADQARDQAMQQAMAQQKMFGANLGLQGLNTATGANQALSQSAMNMGQLELAQLQAQLQGGAVQQGLSQQALNAPYNQYLQQLQYPQTMAKLQSSVLSGLPMTTQNTYGAQLSPFAQTSGAIAGIGSLLGNVGQLPGMSALGSKISDWWNTPSSPFNSPIGSGSLGVADTASGTADWVNAFEAGLPV